MRLCYERLRTSKGSFKDCFENVNIPFCLQMSYADNLCNQLRHRSDFFCGSFMFLFCLVFAMSLCASVYMCFVVTCWERADLLALVCGVQYEFVTFPLVMCGT